ncbi:glycosyltransferase family 2 protein [Thioclava kandeliae]|uniref:Cellulose synthase catalytic subunit n=1 Tax=Thioclava kandeliae TaxID=3070818 RepID=A0ABV1SCS4_9RHOB
MISPTLADMSSILAYNLGLLFLMLALALGLPSDRPFPRRLIGSLTALSVILYAVWRTTQTLPEFSFTLKGLWPWIFWAAEMAAIAYSLASIVILFNHRDNGEFADGAEAMLEASEDWPRVDVFICTYNEPINVLEKSILPALAMDYPDFRVFVCDDTRRPALRAYCEAVGANYLTRPDNAHAKAGNLDNAYRLTDDAGKGDLILVLDADFAPQRQFLRRVVGMFEEPSVGLVQTPQFYYNNDPIQHAFGLSDSFVDDQRVFFDIFQPAKDAVGCAFCVGTSFVVRRNLIAELGGFPKGVLSEDMWLSYKLMELGYQTRWLNERLSVGLSAEGVGEYITQRTRWCLGTIQIGCMPDGPLSPKGRFTLRQRLHYVHGLMSWLSKPFIPLMLIAPVLYWYFDLPAYHADELAFLSFGLPALICFWVYSTWVSGGRTLPLLTEVTHALTALPVTMTLLAALRNPFGKPFKVTDKGGDHSSVKVNIPQATFFGAISMALGLAIALNLVGPLAITEPSAKDLFNLTWAAVAMLISVMALGICYERPRPGNEVEIRMDLAGRLRYGSEILDLRLTGLSVEHARAIMAQGIQRLTANSVCILELDGLPEIPCRIGTLRAHGGRQSLRLEFMPDTAARQALTRHLFSQAPENVARRGQLLPAIGHSLRHLLWA